jgi:hypothetical protein
MCSDRHEVLLLDRIVPEKRRQRGDDSRAAALPFHRAATPFFLHRSVAAANSKETLNPQFAFAIRKRLSKPKSRVRRNLTSKESGDAPIEKAQKARRVPTVEPLSRTSHAMTRNPRSQQGKVTRLSLSRVLGWPRCFAGSANPSTFLAPGIFENADK